MGKILDEPRFPVVNRAPSFWQTGKMASKFARDLKSCARAVTCPEIAIAQLFPCPPIFQSEILIQRIGALLVGSLLSATP